MPKKLNWDGVLQEIEHALQSEQLQKVAFGKPVDKQIQRTSGKVFTGKGQAFLQMEMQYKGGKVVHQNHVLGDASGALIECFAGYGQLNLFTDAYERQFIRTSDETFVLHKTRRQTSTKAEIPAHNREKNLIFPEGVFCDFLFRLGIMQKDGLVAKKYYDKFRQINKFIEFVSNATTKLPKGGRLRVVDLCCGRGVLSFAVYAYLTKCGYEVDMHCIDLKADAIAQANVIATDLGFDGMHFVCADINAFDPPQGADIVISLHACDTATDLALANAVRWGAKIILSSPCCHHEISAQINKDAFPIVLHVPILRERYCETLTDALRAQALSIKGYDVDIVEFIDMEHTHKNLLLVATKHHKTGTQAQVDALRAICDQFGLTPSICKMLHI